MTKPIPYQQLTNIIPILEAVEQLCIQSNNYGEIYGLLRAAKSRLYDVRAEFKEAGT